MLPSKKCCIDSCIRIKYAGYHRLSTLLRLIIKNRLLVYADNYLLAEVHEGLITGFGFTMAESDRCIETIIKFTIIAPPRNIYRLSGDAKDNFLYDLCIQNNCQLLITIDKEILSDKTAPFRRKTDAWLKKRR